MRNEMRSVVTCDREGRVETFDPGAEAVFGYEAGEVVGKKRVSIFSPGPIAIGQVENWLKAAREHGEFETQTVFRKKNGSPFVAEIKITPTFCEGKHVGYCSVTIPKLEVRLEEAMPAIGLRECLLKWVVILRLPFLSASLTAVLIGGAWAGFSRPGAGLSLWTFALVFIAAGAIHVAANVFNDYFDWKTGVDSANTEYFTPFSGGSRAVELGLISQRGVFKVASTALLISTAIGLFLILRGRIALLYFGLFGAFSAYFYTAPPLRFAGRKGIGEFLIGLNFGVLIVAGTAYALTGTLGLQDFLIGVPIGLLTTAILWVNQFPDMPSDAATGKRHLVAVLGKEKARIGYVFLVASAFVFQIFMVAAGLLPRAALLVLLTLPLAFQSSRVVCRSYNDRALVAGCRGTIQLQLSFGLLAAASTFWS